MIVKTIGLLTASAVFAAVDPPECVTPTATTKTLEIQADPDWVHDIEPIIRNRCGQCHRDGGAGPFSLGSHREVAARGRFMLELVDAGRMPPWLPAGTGWRDDRRLTLAEKQLLRRWVDTGAVHDRDGEAGGSSGLASGDATAAITSPAREGWLERGLLETFEIPAESDPAWHQGVIDQRGTTIPLANLEPLRLQGLVIDTGAPQAVRLASFAFDDTGAGRYLDDRDPRVGFLMSADAGLTPSGAHGIVLGGANELRWPEGFHVPVPAGADAVIEWHYRPTGIDETVRPRIQLELVDDGEESRPLRWLPVGVGRVQIPAEAVQVVQSEPVLLTVDAILAGLTPRALQITRTIELLEIPPGESLETATSVLRIGDWDHHQRETLVLESPRLIPAGTRFVARFRLDNRSENPSNPDVPAVDVRRGRRTGVLAVLLHLAAVSAVNDETLALSGPEAVRGLRGRGAVQVD